jgi:hypothetical protein
MAQTDLAVRIATIFDEAGIKKADKAVNKLQKSTSKLGRALGVSLGVAAIAQFGRAAVKAFSEDEKSTAKLSSAVRNLGLAFEQTNINTFISGLEKSASIADETLRPAFQALLTTTGSVTEAQKLLTTAIDASRGSGYDLATVAGDLSKAYVGNTKGLQKYYLGLSKAQLASMSFEEIQAKINKTFEGANKAYLDTAAGKMEAISIATGNFSETVGGALVNALIVASGANGVQGLVTKIDGLAQSVVGAINEFEKFAFITAYTFNPKNILKGSDAFTKALDAFKSKQQLAGAKPYDPLNNSLTGYKLDKAAADAAKKNAALQARLLKQSLDNQKKITAEQKKQALLKKAGSIFDLEQIQLIAALKGNLSEEDRKRVELQFALITGNTAEAQKLTYELAKAQGLGEQLARYLATLPDAKNPFASWDAYLDMLQKKAQDTAAAIAKSTAEAAAKAYSPAALAPELAAIGVVAGGGGSNVSDNQYSNQLLNGLYGMQAAGIPAESMVSYNPSTGLNYNANGNNISLTVTGDSALTQAIANSLQVQSLSGIPSSVQRLVSTFG